MEEERLNKIYRKAKTSLGLLKEKTASEEVSFVVDGRVFTLKEIRYQDDFGNNVDRALLFFLEKLDFLINPLIKDITFIERKDIDENYIQSSAYFNYLTKTVRRLCITSIGGFTSRWEDLGNECWHPLEDYVKAHKKGKKDIDVFEEKIYLSIGTIKSLYFPEENIITPTKETAALFEPIETFVKEYKRKIETEDFEARMTVGKIQDLFAKNKTTRIVFDTEKSIFSVWGHNIEIDKFSDQFHTLRILFEDLTELEREWFYAEIAEKYDSQDRLPDKKFYNAIYQIKQKLKVFKLDDFFLTTRQSVRVNSKYLPKTEPKTN